MTRNDDLITVSEKLQAEDGHAYAWGGGSLVAIVLIVLLLILIF